MNLTELNNLTDAEAAVELARVLTDTKPPYDHDWLGLQEDHECSKCGCEIGSKKADELSCDKPDPLALDWNAAIEMFRAMDISEWGLYCLSVKLNLIEDGYTMPTAARYVNKLFNKKFTPREILTIAYIAKGGV